VWNDQFNGITKTKLGSGVRPDEQMLVEALLRDSAFVYVDDVHTPEAETVQQQVTTALKSAAKDLEKEEKENNLLWWKHKQPAIYHILRTLEPFAFKNLEVGGWANTVNAIKSTHGPSWRMIVHLTDETEAYGIYPGGQSGNPGSRFYQNFIADWAKGKYYTLWMMKRDQSADKRVKWKMNFKKA
jgi:penicillin G amidase